MGIFYKTPEEDALFSQQMKQAASKYLAPAIDPISLSPSAAES